MDLNKPAWDQLCALTAALLERAETPQERREVLAVALLTRRAYEQAKDPEQAARRMLADLLGQKQSRAA
jgi:hypothetical protein